MPALYWAVWKTPRAVWKIPWAVWKTGVFHITSRFPHCSGCFPLCSVLSWIVQNEMSCSFPSNRSTEKTVKINPNQPWGTVVKTYILTVFSCLVLLRFHKIWTISIFDTKFESKIRRNKRKISMVKIVISVNYLSTS